VFRMRCGRRVECWKEFEQLSIMEVDVKLPDGKSEQVDNELSTYSKVSMISQHIRKWGEGGKDRPKFGTMGFLDRPYREWESDGFR